MRNSLRRLSLVFIFLVLFPVFSHARDSGVFPFRFPWKIAFLSDDGVVQPARCHQRYRRQEFAQDRPFFQWWYFAVKDLKNNRYFALDYSISDCVHDPTNEGSYVLFAMVDKKSGKNFQKYERYPLANFNAERDFDIAIRNDGAVDFAIEVIDNDTYHVRGKMRNPSKVWFAQGCDPALSIEWDLLIHRNYGWYGQQDVQDIARVTGLISWNTYAHDSEVEGYIKVGDTTYPIERNENFRAYCDENWGQEFPVGSPSISFPWGWYHVNVSNRDPSKDLSIIAGIGRYDFADLAWASDFSNILYAPVLGRFADIRLNGGTHIGVRSAILSPNSVQDDEYAGIETTNDGSVKRFTVERGNWVDYTDSIGSARIPLDQKVTMEMEHYKVIMDFRSQIEDYNRLLFPHEDYVFSDFEALGVNVHVLVYKKAWGKKYERILDFWSDDGGLEYGYNVNK